MGKSILKSSLIIGIVFLFLSTSCLPIVTSSNEKPDLIIENIYLFGGHFPFDNSFYCTVRNIGNSSIYKNTYVEVYVKVYWLLFRHIPLIPIKSFITQGYIYDSLIGEKKINFFFLSDTDFPLFGYFRIFLNINPNRLINDINFDNNVYYRDCVIFLYTEAMI